MKANFWTWFIIVCILVCIEDVGEKYFDMQKDIHKTEISKLNNYKG
jgi:hypothetical protein